MLFEEAKGVGLTGGLLHREIKVFEIKSNLSIYNNKIGSLYYCVG